MLAGGKIKLKEPKKNFLDKKKYCEHKVLEKLCKEANGRLYKAITNKDFKQLPQTT